MLNQQREPSHTLPMRARAARLSPRIRTPRQARAQTELDAHTCWRKLFYFEESHLARGCNARNCDHQILTSCRCFFLESLAYDDLERLFAIDLN